MKNPLFDKKHVKEYLIYGFTAAVLYMVLVLFFLADNKYENLYLPYIGNFLFIAIIGAYTGSLIKREYEGKRSVSMLIAGHLALIAGIIFSVIFVVIGVFTFYPGLFSAMHPNELLPDSPSSIRVTYPAGLIFMLMANIILVSGGGASLLIVIFSYAAKRNQTKDKPASLEKYIPN